MTAAVTAAAAAAATAAARRQCPTRLVICNVLLLAGSARASRDLSYSLAIGGAQCPRSVVLREDVGTPRSIHYHPSTQHCGHQCVVASVLSASRSRSWAQSVLFLHVRSRALRAVTLGRRAGDDASSTSSSIETRCTGDYEDFYGAAGYLVCEIWNFEIFDFTSGAFMKQTPCYRCIVAWRIKAISFSKLSFNSRVLFSSLWNSDKHKMFERLIQL